MSVARVIEVVGQSEKSFEDAVSEAVKQVSAKISTVKCVDVVKWTANVANGNLINFRADCKVLYLED